MKQASKSCWISVRQEPGSDPYWGGMYFASDSIYNLGIGLTTTPNFGRVYPCSTTSWSAPPTPTASAQPMADAHNQGHFIEEDSLGGDTLLSTWELDHPIPTHLSAIAIGPYVDHDYVHAGAFGDIPVRLTSKANDSALMQTAELGFAIDAPEHCGSLRPGALWLRPHHRRCPRNPHQHRLPAFHD